MSPSRSGRSGRDTRFSKGQSGNPKGRPRGSSSLSATDAFVLKAGDRPITIREGDVVQQVSAQEALIRSQQTAGMKGGSYAQQKAIERYERADAERQARIDESNIIAERYVTAMRMVIANSERAGLPPPRILPHPDDVIADPERGMRVIGPKDEEEQAKLEHILQVIDLLILQDALDQREYGSEFDDPLDRPSSALMFALVLNDRVPKRYCLSDGELSLRMMRAESTSKRLLLTTLYRGWRRLGARAPRGARFPTKRAGLQYLELLAAAIG